MITPGPEEIAVALETLDEAGASRYLHDLGDMFPEREETELPAEVVLGSKSPRREMILGNLLGIPHSCVVIGADETVPSGSHSPETISKCLTVQKFLAYLERSELVFEAGNVLLVGDTIVVGHDGEILGKEPEELRSPREKHEYCLKRIGGYLGHPINVFSSVIVVDFRLQRVLLGSDRVAVHFRKPGPEAEALVQRYCRLVLDPGNAENHRGPIGKAGSFGIQEPEVLSLVEKVDGDITVAIGLPAALTARLLRQLPGLSHAGNENGPGYSFDRLLDELIAPEFDRQQSPLSGESRDRILKLVSGQRVNLP